MPPEEEAERSTEQHFALIIQHPGKAEQTLAKFIKMLMSYKYGLATEIIHDFVKVRSALRRGADKLKCTFVIQRQQVSARNTIPALTAKGRLPLFLILPGYVASEQSEETDLENVYTCPWEMAFTTVRGLCSRP